MIKKGYIVQLSSQEAKKVSKRTYYLPAFLTFNPNKLPKKFRNVYDGAAKYMGHSLNDLLFTGPDNICSLLRILLQFREGTIAVSGDIEGMFLQVRLAEGDQDSLRLLWFDPETDEEVTYKLIRLPFGLNCSPFLSQYVKNRNAEDFKDEFPEAHKAITEQHYVDDYIASFKTAEDAIQTCTDTIEVHRRGGFNIRNFVSNSTEVTEALPKDKVAENQQIDLGDKSGLSKVLGLQWNVKNDTITYRLNPNKVTAELLEGKRVPTKRSILSITMSLFDPLGQIAHLTIHGKILLQDIWKSGLDWDQEILPKHFESWKKWVNYLSCLPQISIPRCYSALINKVSNAELHVFTDASLEAYAAVAYLRFEHQGQIDVSLIMGKSRVAPNKPLSMPRLELLGAVLGSRLAKLVKGQLRFINISKTYYWTDSKTVLAWIQSHARNYKIFVALRIGEIHENSNENEWNWINSAANPADLGTKYGDIQAWFQPAFLLRPKNEWPTLKLKLEPPTEEIKNLLSIKVVDLPTFTLERFSTWEKARFAVAILMKFKKWIAGAKLTFSDQDKRVTYPNLVEAATWLFQKCQQEAFQSEYIDLQNKEKIKSGQLRNLCPFMGADGLIRMKGRLDKSKTATDSLRNPIILPNKHEVTNLLVDESHRKNWHQGQETIIVRLRQRFWIIHIRSAVRRAKKRCQICKNDAAKPRNPLMGHHPLARTEGYLKAFLYSGVDMFGPLEVCIGRRREKRYGIIFTCLTVRAVHLELARDQSTDAFIMCLRNFQNRRGKIRQLFSDNGRNFVGAEAELSREARNLEIEWNFICPSNPEAGGIWERKIQIVKKILNKIFQGQSYREDTLRSALIEAEYIINCTPLTHVPMDHEDDRVLTPNDFLIPGGVSDAPYCPELIVTRKQWRITQNLAQHFGKRWVRECIPALNIRKKWTQPAEPLKVDDIVILSDENQPRDAWRKGRIIAVKTAADGQVRTCTVKTAQSTYQRPANRLAKLDVRRDVQNEVTNEGEPPLVTPDVQFMAHRIEEEDVTYPLYRRMNEAGAASPKDVATSASPKDVATSASPEDDATSASPKDVATSTKPEDAPMTMPRWTLSESRIGQSSN
jgi:hypothetical protein